MPERENPPEAPDWESHFDIAESQAGHFTTRQAAGAGYSPQLLAYLVDKKVERAAGSPPVGAGSEGCNPDDELPEGTLGPHAALLEDADDAAAARKALDDPERIPYEQVRQELGLDR